MSDDLSSKTALCFDHGLFIPLAHRLAKDFGKVYYHSPWARGFPTINECAIGDGFPDIERTDYPLDLIDSCDLFVFPDILHSDLQTHLVSMGKRVWGARRGDSLELWREKFHRVLNKVGLEVPSFVSVQGLTSLRETLRDKKDKWIKISKFRGSFETAHWRSFQDDEGLLDLWGVKFGPAKELVNFMVFDEIETDLEIGGDTYNVVGEWPSLMLHGDEWKDKGYMGAVTKREDMPDQLKAVLDAFSPVLKEFDYRQQWSMEIRVAGDKAYFIDATCRGGLPSTGSQLELWKNFSEIVWHGGNGELVDPEPTAQFSAECVLTMKGDKTMWSKLEVPEELKDAMKLAGCCEIDGMACFPPDDCTGDAIGWLVATGDTMRETIEKMKEYAGLLPDGVEAKTDSLINLLQEIQAAEEHGIEFSGQPIPEPASVIEE